MAPRIFPRDDSSSTPSVTNYIYVAGFTIAGLVVVAVSLWVLIRYQRRRMSKKRCEERGAAFLHVRGVVRPMMAEVNPSSTSIPDVFSRDGLTPSIIMPERTLARMPISPGSSGKVPIASQPGASPPSFPSSCPPPCSNTPSGSPRLRAMSILNPAHSQHRRSFSGFSGHSQPRFPPGLHSRESSASSTSSSQARPVRQLFEPVLADELSITRSGEYLTLLHSFDDGWCLVARDTSRPFFFRSSRLSGQMKSNSEHIEVGLVPAWVFARPMKGVIVSRPVRSTSVNVLQAAQDSPPSRNALISWSNFA
ncbi:hypothetical protein PAXINDRAFT_101058 [Paxillus involutus ATCC 200175]|uniref:Unplaced genomic scaffold PAXINscaffold_37, whole genome shotgun sequence n=1 Tax=Paxillus involutus ATCC 200175 TaxID=664439 RepID=A0A0C9TQT9_PAXIN|nr:hypothetical protein PAXINDRAFT_101058 [Paxillus involutus ATCC 200175]